MVRQRVKSQAQTPAQARPGSQTAASDLRQRSAVNEPDLFTTAAAVQEALSLSGQPLDPQTRVLMESRFGHNFSRVRVHTGEKAAAAARALKAEAFTVGQDIYFAAGRYQPRAAQGRWLLAHELTHTLQQRISPSIVARSPVQPSYSLTGDNDALELEAAQAANKVTTGEHVEPQHVTVAAPRAQGIIARKSTSGFAEDLARLPSAFFARFTSALVLDPARLIDNLADIVLKSLRQDPDDRSGRVRRQIERMVPSTRDKVLERVKSRLTQADWIHLTDILKEPAPMGESSVQGTAAQLDDAGQQTSAAEESASTGQTATAETNVETETDRPTAGTRAETQAETQAEISTRPETSTAPPAPGRGAAEATQTTEPPAAMPEVPELQAEAATPQAETAQGAAPVADAAPAPAAAPAAAPGATPSPAAATAGEPVAGGGAESMEAGAGMSEEAGAPPEEVEAAASEVGESDAESGVAQAGVATGDEATAVEGEETGAAQDAAVDTGVAAANGNEQAAAEDEAVAEDEVAEAAATEGAPVEAAAGEPAMTAPPEIAPETATDNAPPEIATPTSTETAEPPVDAAPEAMRASAMPAVTPAAPAPAAAAPVIEEPETAAAEVSTPEGDVVASEAPGVETAPASEGTNDGVEAGGAGAPGAEGAPGAPGGCQASGQNPQEGAQAEAGGEGGGGACGGGGGGAAATPTPPPAPPDVSQSDPAQALASVSNLRPAQLQAALGGVTASVSHSVGQHRDELAANPPQIERPSGAPAGQTGEARAAGRGGASASADRRNLERVPTGAPVPIPEPDTPQLAAAPAPQVPTPRVAGNAQGQLSEADVHNMQVAVRNLPTTDPSLHVTVGAPPQLALEGDADPARAREQRATLDTSAAEAQAQGQLDAAAPMGEDHIYPSVPSETLTAELPTGGESGGGGGAVAGGETADEAASIVAHEERGEEIRASVTQAQTDVVARQQEHAAQVETEQATSQREVSDAIAQNAEEQTAERNRTRQAVQRARGEWSEGQRAATTRARTEADEAGQRGERDIDAQRTRANTRAAERVRQGNTEVAGARRESEQHAAQQRQRAQNESGGFLSWVASRFTAFFNRIKQSIIDGFAAARRRISSIIESVTEFAMSVIESARNLVVGLIRAIGDALIAIGDVLLAAFPELRDRFRRAINDYVDQAVEAVNRYADALKEEVKRRLNALGAALIAALGALERGLLALVNAVASVVQAAIQFARSVMQALAAFAELITDIAAGPGQWLSNLASSVVSGIRNCLWSAFKLAVKNWFNQKVEEVLGLGMMIWNVLRSGCISAAQVGRMAWSALKAAIPTVLVQLLIEKLVAMIVPAAGALMTIIEGLRAAWGTVSRIIAAFQLFFIFLKAVKNGNAGPQFANAVAAAAVVVIDFVANWLLMRLRRPAGAVSGRLRAMAQRIGQSMRRVGGAVRRGGRAVGRAARSGARAVRRGAQAVRRGATAAGRAVARRGRAAGRAIARRGRAAGRAISRSGAGRAALRGARVVGRAARRGYAAARSAVQRGRERVRQWRERRRQRRQAALQERLNRAVRAIEPRARALLSRGVSRPRLWATLAGWRAWYRLSALSIKKQGHSVQFTARVNPAVDFGNGFTMEPQEVSRMLREVIAEVVARHPRLLERADQTAPENIALTQPEHYPAAALQARAATGGVPGRQMHNIQMGNTGLNIQEERSQTSQYVHGFSGSGSYPDVLRELRATGLSDAQIAGHMSGIVQHGSVPFPLRPESREALGRATWLMFGTESARNTANIAMAPMTLQLIQSGQMNFDQAFTGGRETVAARQRFPGRDRILGRGGQFPMSMRGGIEASLAVDQATGFRRVRRAHGVTVAQRVLGKRRGGVRGPDSAWLQTELMQREADLVAMWVRARLGNQAPVALSETVIRQMLIDLIEQYYRLHQPQAVAPAPAATT
jgi:hypothetical protein